MADPITIVGLVAGLTSLGIQVCGGITTYLDAIKCHADDIAYVKRQVQSLETVLQVVRTTLPRIDSSHQASITAVVECLKLFETEIEALRSFVSKLTGGTTTAANFKDKVKEQTKKLTYAFNRTKLDQLESRLVHANGIFQTSLQGLNLGVSSSSLRALETNSRTISTDLLVARSEVALLNGPLERLNNNLPSIQQSVNSLAPLLVSQTTTLSSHIENVNLQVQDTIERLQGDFQSSVVHRLDRLEQTIQHFEQSNHVKLDHMLNELFPQGETRPIGKEPQSSDIVVGRLIAKPDNLRSLHNELSSFSEDSGSSSKEPLAHFKSTSLRSSFNLDNHYIYGRRKRNRYRRIQWGSFEFYDEDKLTEADLPDCNAYRFISRQRSMGLKYRGVGKLLRRAVNIAFSMSAGAGGFSIAPSFTYYATVDDRAAPAFQLLKTLNGYIDSFVVNRAKYFNDLAEIVFKKIIKLYHERKASPTDVDAENCTLLHFAGDLILSASNQDQAYHDQTLPFALKLFRVLLEYGVPIMCDIKGRTAHGIAFYGLSGSYSYSMVAESLIIPGIGSSDLVTSTPYYGPDSSIQGIRILRISQRIAELYACGPLSLAILRGEAVEEIKHILMHYPSTIHEIDVYGRTPLHIAAGQPECLQVLFEAADVQLLNSVDYYDYSAMDYALYLSGKICHAELDGLCDSICPCSKCPEILLRTDCVPSTEWGIIICFHYASLKVRMAYTAELRSRRESLKRLAKLHLPYSEIEGFGLKDEDVLDRHTARVIKQLEKQNVAIPPSLGTGSQFREGDYPSIYDYINRASDAEYIFNLGFRDLNATDYDGFPTLADAALMERSISYLLWLSENGAELYHRLSYTDETSSKLGIRGATSAHWVFYAIGDKLKHLKQLDTDEESAVGSLKSKVMPVEITDECFCRCSLGGCSPFLWMLKSMTRYRIESKTLAQSVSWYIEHYGTHMTVQHHKESIRFITFEALSIRHTCCGGGLLHDRTPNYDAEDIQEIEEEQASLLENLERLVLDFEGKVTEILENGAIDTSAALAEFWTGYWCGRIDELLGELDGCEISPEEKIGAERLGVKWDGTAVAVETPKEDRTDINYWYRRIDEIA